MASLARHADRDSDSDGLHRTGMILWTRLVPAPILLPRLGGKQLSVHCRFGAEPGGARAGAAGEDRSRAQPNQNSMFSILCFWTASKWHGISYAGGGLNTEHGRSECSTHATPEDSMAIKPHYYMLGGKGEVWAKGPEIQI